MAIPSDVVKRIRNRKFWLPTALSVVFLVFVLVALQTGNRKYRSLSRELAQWDGQHYLSIARDGYEMNPPTYFRPRISGNVGWFPLYPLLGRLVSVTGLSMPWSMALASWFCFWLAMLVLYYTIDSKYGERSAIFTMLAMLVYPASFYFATAFPYSLYLLLASLAYYMLHKKKYALLLLPAAGLAVTYPSGAVIGLPLAYHLIRHWKNLKRPDRLWLVVAIVSIAAALFFFFLHYHFKFGDFFLYLTYQSQWVHDHTLTFPLLTLYKSLTVLSYAHLEFLILVLTLGTAVLVYSRKVEVEWQIYMIGILLFTPTFGTVQCYYRHVVVAFPLFLMIGLAVSDRWRRYVVGAYAVASILLAWFVFVPAFKKGLLM